MLTAFERWPSWNEDVKSMSMNGPVAEGSVFRWKAGPGTALADGLRYLKAEVERSGA